MSTIDVTVRYFAAARDAAGLAEEQVALPAGATLADLIDDAARRHRGTTHSGLSLADVAGRCSFLLDGRRADPDTPLAGIARVDMLPPFAGG